MKDDEKGHIAKAFKGLNIILTLDSDELCSRVTLEPAERKLLDEAKIGIGGILSSLRNRLKEGLDNIQEHIKLATDLSLQGEMFDSDGKPKTPADANGKLIPTQRQILDVDGSGNVVDCEEEPDFPEIGEDEEDGFGEDEAEEDEAIQPAKEWSIKGDEDQIVTQILQAIRDGYGKISTCQDIAGRTGKTQVMIRGIWDRLEEQNVIRKHGGEWTIAEETQESAAA